MRRKDREITHPAELLSVMERCDVCRLALNDGDYPYILPLNFGMECKTDVVTLYFHGANEGYKYEAIARDNRVSFEMDCSHRLVTDEAEGMCTMEYDRVIGRGRIERIDDEQEKLRALRLIMSHYHRDGFPFSEAAVPRTTVLKLTVERITGKRRFKR